MSAKKIINNFTANHNNWKDGISVDHGMYSGIQEPWSGADTDSLQKSRNFCRQQAGFLKSHNVLKHSKNLLTLHELNFCSINVVMTTQIC